MKSYFHSKDQIQYGPLPEHELRRMLATGDLDPQTPVWCEGMTEWIPASGVFVSAGPPPISPVPSGGGDDFGMRMLLPVGRSAWAIAAGYLGLFSLVILPAPISLVVSIIAIRDVRKSRSSPKPKHGMGRAVFGLVMGILGTLVLLLGVIAAIQS